MQKKNRMNWIWALAGLLLLGPARLAAQENPATSQPTPRALAQEERSPAPTGSTDRLTLDELIQEALENNPAVQSAARRVEAFRRRVPQARALPDPKVSVGWMGNLKPFGVMRQDPSSFRSVTATQELPFPGKLKLRGQMADREAQAAWWDYEEVRRRVVAQVKVAYYDYFYYQKAIEITRKNQNLLESLARIAEVRYQVGEGIQQDVLRAQVELSRIRQRLTLLEQQRDTARARINSLLNRAPEAPLPAPAPFEAAELGYELEALYQMARENDPGLQREDRLIEHSQVAVNLARREYYPDLRVGYMYQNRPTLREMHGFTFTINIPVFYRSKQQEGVREATQGLLAARRSRENRETMLYFEVKEQYLAVRAAEELARLYSRAIVPQSSLALDSAMAAYQVGQLDFLTVLDSYILVLDYEISYYRELTNFQIALARLEPLVGAELTK